MSFVGQTVKHNTFGLGKVTSVSNDRIAVKFESRETESKFIFPDTFGDRLKFTDSVTQSQVESLLTQKLLEKTRAQQKAENKGKTQPVRTLPQSPEIKTEKAQPAARLNNYTGESVPSSAIMLASLSGEDRHYGVMIVSDQTQQASSKGIYWKNRELSKKIIDAHFTKSNRFIFDGKEYNITGVKTYPKYSSVSAYWHKLNNADETKELYIFKQKGIYDNPENGYELVDAKLYFPEKKQAIKVAVYYQASLSRYFMNEETFMPLVRSHGMPKVKLSYTEDATPDSAWSGSFSEESKLKRLGYSVQQADGMSAGERQNLLSSIIRTGQMTDAEVANHLEMLIHLNSGKISMMNACGCWRADLKFVQDNFGDMRRQKEFYGSGETPKKSSLSTRNSVPSNRSTSRSTSSTRSSASSSSSTSKGTSTTRSSASSNSSTARSTSSTRSSASSNSSTSKSTSSSTTNRATGSTKSTSRKSNAASKAEKRKKALEERRDSLLVELSKATGLFNFFKRHRIKRELQDVEDTLRRL